MTETLDYERFPVVPSRMIVLDTDSSILIWCSVTFWLLHCFHPEVLVKIFMFITSPFSSSSHRNSVIWLVMDTLLVI